MGLSVPQGRDRLQFLYGSALGMQRHRQADRGEVNPGFGTQTIERLGILKPGSDGSMSRILWMVVALGLSSCCGDNDCRLDRALDRLPDQEAFSRFRTLGAKEQVDVCLWELAHSKPVASRYEFLLRENAKEVARPLLDAANRSDGCMVQASILRSLAKLPADSRAHLARSRLAAAVDRCKRLAGSGRDEVCATYGEMLLR